MHEINRVHHTINVGGKTRRIRELAQRADVVEAVSRMLKTPLVLNSDVDWEFKVEEQESTIKGKRLFKATAINDGDGPDFFYDFIVDENKILILQIFVMCVKLITGKNFDDPIPVDKED